MVLQFSHDPPVTTATVTGQQNEQGAYTGPANVSLSAVPGQGYTLAGTFYQIDGGSVQTYTGPFSVSDPGVHAIKYWSKDTTGVTETPKTLSLTLEIPQTDTTPPEVTPRISPPANAKGWHREDVRRLPLHGQCGQRGTEHRGPSDHQPCRPPRYTLGRARPDQALWVGSAR